VARMPSGTALEHGLPCVTMFPKKETNEHKINAAELPKL